MKGGYGGNYPVGQCSQERDYADDFNGQPQTLSPILAVTAKPADANPSKNNGPKHRDYREE
jgi:hypothetical protein